VKAWEILSEAAAPDGGRLQLARRDQELVIRVNGQLLMSSRTHGSEEAMAAAGITSPHARVLVGGLGCGYTVRAALQLLDDEGQVVVAEIAQAVIDWNRGGPLAPLAGNPLGDPRVTVQRADVRALLGPPRAGAAPFDAILLDVDNGPEALSARGNQALYQPEGLGRAWAALRPGGTLVVWSAGPHAGFTNRLRGVGFSVEVRAVPIRGAGVGGTPSKAGGKHTLFVATRPTRK
jgi:spermidine synthase